MPGCQHWFSWGSQIPISHTSSVLEASRGSQNTPLSARILFSSRRLSCVCCPRQNHCAIFKFSDPVFLPASFLTGTTQGYSVSWKQADPCWPSMAFQPTPWLYTRSGTGIVLSVTPQSVLGDRASEKEPRDSTMINGLMLLSYWWAGYPTRCRQKDESDPSLSYILPPFPAL